jgi:hypothetical protein
MYSPLAGLEGLDHRDQHSNENDVVSLDDCQRLEDHHFVAAAAQSPRQTHPSQAGMEGPEAEYRASSQSELHCEMEECLPVEVTPPTSPEDPLPELPEGSFADFLVSPPSLPASNAPIKTGTNFLRGDGNWVPRDTVSSTERSEGVVSSAEFIYPVSREQLRWKGSSVRHKDLRLVGPAQTVQRSIQDDIFASICGGNDLGSALPVKITAEHEDDLARRIHHLLDGNSVDQALPVAEEPVTFSCAGQLLDFWNLYFVHFDRVSGSSPAESYFKLSVFDPKHCPILHHKLVQPLSCPALIAAIVTTVGANYSSTLKGSQFHQYAFSKLCDLLQALRVRGDLDYNPSGQVLVAVCILLCHATRSRNHEGAQVLASCLHRNISYLDNAGLFRQQQSSQSLNLQADPSTFRSPRALQACMDQIRHQDEAKLQEQWLAWVKEEICRRLAWAHLVCITPSSSFLP